MFPSLTNLLPEEYVRALRRDYRLRFATVAILALALVVVVNCILLVPAHLLVHQDVTVQSRALSQVANTNANAQENTLNQQLSTLAQQTQYLSTLSSVATASGSFRTILAVPRPGISITGFSFTAPTPGNPGTMLVTGVADTREDLRSYVNALSTVPSVTNANLPISDYAQASNIPFTITLTGSFSST